MAELRAADPAFLNRLAWNLRWADRRRSAQAAQVVVDASDGRDALRVERARALRTLAWQARWRGDFDAALSHGFSCNALISTDEATDLRGDCYSILAVVHYSRNRLDLAQDATARGLELRNLPDAGRIELLTTRATILRYAGHAAKSGVTLVRAREIATDAELARVEQHLARWMLCEGDHKGALRHGRLSLDLAEEHRNRIILPYACEVTGAAACALGHLDEAEALWARGIRLAIDDGDMRVLCQLIECSATLEVARGSSDRAIDLLRHGAEIAQDLDYALWKQRYALALADVHEGRGEIADALHHYKQAWAIQGRMRKLCIGAGLRSG